MKRKCSYLERGDPGLGPVDRHPDFFVVDDQYSDRNRWHRVEADWSTVKPGLLAKLVAMLRDTNGRRVYLALGKGGLLVSAEYIGCEGKFAQCASVGDIELLCAPIQ